MRSNKEDRKAGIRRSCTNKFIKKCNILYTVGEEWGTEPSYNGVKSAGSRSHDVAQREHRTSQVHPRLSAQRLRNDNSSLFLRESHAPRNWNYNPWRPRPEPQPRPCQVHPWTRTRNSHSLCLFFHLGLWESLGLTWLPTVDRSRDSMTWDKTDSQRQITLIFLHM